MRPLAALVAAAIGASMLSAQAGIRAAAPASVEEVLASQLTLSRAQIDTVRNGQPVVVAVPPRVNREIAVAGVVRIAAPASRVADAVRDIERLERGPGFLATRKFSSPPTLADVATLRLPDQDVRALRSCRIGRCDVKLGAGAFDTLGRIDWRAADAAEQVNRLAREMAVSYVEDYRRGGNRALAIYRDTPTPIDIADELSDMVRRSTGLTAALPEVSDYLLKYPEGRPASVDDYFYWSLAEFGLKPVVRINHVVVHATGAEAGLQYAITTKQLYASHYFHAALEVRALFADPERPAAGHYLVVLNLARTDGMTGLMGGVVKSKARSGARAGLLKALGAMKRLAEAGA